MAERGISDFGFFRTAFAGKYGVKDQPVARHDYDGSQGNAPKAENLFVENVRIVAATSHHEKVTDDHDYYADDHQAVIVAVQGETFVLCIDFGLITGGCHDCEFNLKYFAGVFSEVAPHRQ